ncbi:Catechol O-methyltransferase [Pelobates cultripes]|uniref:catechol O-methyltransferase n=1 Tax=Pelobates cultripes TaxID=61616 RepID=A0AAD1WAP9_PELCU|nr:Catechol O-methyltransferase [Pelobates cultripes]
MDSCTIIFGIIAFLTATLYITYKRNRGMTKIYMQEIWQTIKNVFLCQSKEQRVLAFVQKNAVRGDPQSVIDNIDKYCSQREWAMNVGDQKGLILDKIVKETNPSVLLELGTYCGYSAVRIGRLLKPGARFYTLEINPTFAAIAKQIIEFAGLKDKVRT